MAGPIRISILANAARARAELKNVGGDLESLASRAKGAAGGLLKIAGGFAALAGVGAVGSILHDSLDEARESQKVGAQTNAVLKSTRGIANVTAKSIGTLSTAISNKTGIDDEQIQSSANMLLTFTNVRNEVGKGNRIFDQATRTITDMSVALGTDSKNSAIQLGKALNDPIKGITALQRVGVSFTADQKNQIKTLVTTGHTLDAQKLILRELNKEFGGSAAAQATGAEKARVAFKNLEEQVGTALLPTIDRFANYTTTKVIPAISKFFTEMQNGTGRGGQFASFLREIGGDVRTLSGYVRSAVGFLAGLPSGLKSVGAEALVAAVGFSRLSGAISASRSSGILGLITDLKSAEGRTKALSGAVRNVAGAGGLGLLIDSSHRASGGLSTLESIGGAAALGFSVGGPWGGVAGGVVGGLISIFKAAHKAGDGFGFTKGQAQQLSGTLDQVTGRATAATRSLIIASHAKEIALAAKTGVSGATIADAIVGNAAAQARVRAAITNAKNGIAEIKAEMAKPVPGRTADQAAADAEKYAKRLKDAQDQLKALQSVAGDTSAFNKQAAATRINNAQALTYRDLLKRFPKSVATDIKANGVDHSLSAVRALARQYNLTPKQIQTAARIAGFDLSIEQVRQLKAAIDALKDKTVTLTTVKKTIQSQATKNLSTPDRPGSRTTGDSNGSDLLDDDNARKKKTGKAASKALDALKKKLAALQDKLGSVSTSSLRDQLDAATSSLKDAQQAAADYVTGIRDSFKSFGDITSFLNSDSPFTVGGAADSLVANLQAKVTQAKQFASIVTNLKNAGLNQDALDQILAAGPASAFATAQAIQDGGASTIAQINDLQAQLSAAGEQLGTNVRPAMYDVGVQVAQGLIDGINAQIAQVQAQIASLTTAIVKHTKKKLKVKSPSRVFAEIGENVTKGLLVGIKTPDVSSTMSRLSGQIVSAFDTPTLTAQAVVGGSTNGTPVQITVQVPVGASGAQVGKELAGYLAEYVGTGGKVLVA